ncbi:hypothetical protein ONE63_007070 [Megalurothrips usitatus]|uniref:Follicle cell protein 3C-1 n=1 Tax=Megalurothrips usitatus TaxID=439358 RepID=A0AAV7XQV6_9NEOP|nr:hypothetical protein ONE63_007070 [Megalurothrips usitatus]
MSAQTHGGRRQRFTGLGPRPGRRPPLPSVHRALRRREHRVPCPRRPCARPGSLQETDRPHPRQRPLSAWTAPSSSWSPPASCPACCGECRPDGPRSRCQRPPASTRELRSACPLANCVVGDAAVTVAASAPTATPSPTPTAASTPSTSTPRTSSASPPPRLTLPGVRPMKDRGNSSEPVPCTCGIFMSRQCKGPGQQPVGVPAISHEFTRATSSSAYGTRQCTTACVDMIVKHLPNSAAIICSSIERDCTREKAFLFIKNHRNKWLGTRLSAGREFCCKGGVPVKCTK